MEDASEIPIIQCTYLLLSGRGQTPYLRTIEKYWENARIVEPELGFQCDTRSPDVLVQCKHGLTDKSGAPFNFQLAAS